jgi:predicted transcriptional regulator
MSEAPVQQPSFKAQHVMAAVADIMRSPVTTVQQNDHAAAATFLMKHAGASALVVLDSQTDKPIGIITEVSRVKAQRAWENSAYVRRLLGQRQPGFAAALAFAEQYFSCLCGPERRRGPAR